MQPARTLPADAATTSVSQGSSPEPRPGQVTAAEWRWLAGIGLLLVALLALPYLVARWAVSRFLTISACRT